MAYKRIIIDGPYLAHRSQSSPYHLTTSTGLDSTLIHGFLRSLRSIKNRFTEEPSLMSPGYTPKLIITWESHGTPSWRRQQLPTYKPTSLENDDQYISQVNDLKLILNYLNLTQYYSPTNEADDVIASLLFNNPIPTLIYTTDKDIHQLISNSRNHHIFSNKEIIFEEDVLVKFGIRPTQIPDYLGLVGDKSDNIKGVFGVGPVKASTLLNNYQTIEEIPISAFKRPSDKALALFNKKLTLLNKTCDLLPISDKTDVSLIDLLRKYELNSIIKQIESYKKLA